MASDVATTPRESPESAADASTLDRVGAKSVVTAAAATQDRDGAEFAIAAAAATSIRESPKPAAATSVRESPKPAPATSVRESPKPAAAAATTAANNMTANDGEAVNAAAASISEVNQVQDSHDVVTRTVTAAAAAAATGEQVPRSTGKTAVLLSTLFCTRLYTFPDLPTLSLIVCPFTPSIQLAQALFFALFLHPLKVKLAIFRLK